MRFEAIFALIFSITIVITATTANAFADQEVEMDVGLSGPAYLNPVDVTVGDGEDVTFVISANVVRSCIGDGLPSPIGVQVDAHAFFPETRDELNSVVPIFGGEITVHNFKWPSAISSPAPYSVSVSCMVSSPLAPDPIEHKVTATGNFLKKERLEVMQMVPQLCIQKGPIYHTIATFYSGEIYRLSSLDGCPTDVKKLDVTLPIDHDFEIVDVIVCQDDKNPTGIGPCRALDTCPACSNVESAVIVQTPTVIAAVNSWKGGMSTEEYLSQVSRFVASEEISIPPEPTPPWVWIAVGLAISVAIGITVAFARRRPRA